MLAGFAKPFTTSVCILLLMLYLYYYCCFTCMTTTAWQADVLAGFAKPSTLDSLTQTADPNRGGWRGSAETMQVSFFPFLAKNKT